MSRSIHGVVEYQDLNVSRIVWDLGQVFFPSTHTDIQELLGLHEPKDSVVPLRGHPTGDTSSGYHNAFTALVIRGEALGNGTEFDENGQHRESDGMVLNEYGAERWMSYGSVWVEDDWHDGYRRLSDPDMGNVNWITRKEYKAAVDEAQRRAPQNPNLSTHRAVLASMKALEKSGHKGVRFVYGAS